MEGGHGQAERRLTTFLEEKRVIFICFCIAFSQFQYGYDSAAVAGFQTMPGFLRIYGYADPEIETGYNISTKVQRLIQSLMNVGGLTAAIIIYVIGSRTSRRVGLWIACLIGAVAISVQISSRTLGALYAGRLLLGISNGFYIPYSVTYMGEVAPSHLRGPIVGMVTFQTSLGALFGILVDNYTNVHLGRSSYQIPLAVMYVIPLFIGVLLLFLPDTPRYYVSRGNYEKAAIAIQRTRGITDTDRIRAEVLDIKDTYLAEEALYQGLQLKDMFRGAHLRRTLISIGAAIGQTATGITFLAGYSVYFYIQARIGSPFIWVMVGLAIALTGNMAAFPAMRFLNRRLLLISCSVISAIMMFAMAIVYTVSPVGSVGAGKALVGLSIVFTWIYGIGQGPVMWAISTEMPSQRFRSQTVGLGNGLNFVFGWLCAFCTPYFINPQSLNWGPKYGYIWGGSNVILALWALFCVPETKGRSLEQLDELFEKRVPTWKFASYVTEHKTVDADKELAKQVGKDAEDRTIHIEHVVETK